MYHFTECGLDNIYLINGVEEDSDGIFIHHLSNLHRAIAKTLVFKNGSLNCKEIKFIRSYLDLSQKRLGILLGVDYQTVLAWEKEKYIIPKTADILLRTFLYAHLFNNQPVNDMDETISAISELDEADTNVPLKIEFMEVNDEWKLGDAA